MSLPGRYDPWRIDPDSVWNPTLTWKTSKTDPTPIDLTGWGCRLTVLEVGTKTDPVLAIAAPDDITLGGDLGTITWAVQPDGFVLPEYDATLIVIPPAGEAFRKALVKGRLAVSPSTVVHA